MKINVKRIPAEGEAICGEDPASILQLEETDLRFSHDVTYDLHAQIRANALLVTGRLQTVVGLRCGRCLRQFEQPVAIEQFVLHQELTGEDFVDLTPQIREDIILELPQRALCREDCRGLCPHCGVDRNQTSCQCDTAPRDHRWEGLDQLNLK